MYRIGILLFLMVGVPVFGQEAIPTQTIDSRIERLEAQVSQLNFELERVKRTRDTPINSGIQLRLYNAIAPDWELMYTMVRYAASESTTDKWNYVGVSIGNKDGLFGRIYQFKRITQECFYQEYGELRNNSQTGLVALLYGSGLMLQIAPRIVVGGNIAAGVFSQDGTVSLRTPAEFFLQANL